jgi:hypothetical protein
MVHTAVSLSATARRNDPETAPAGFIMAAVIIGRTPQAVHMTATAPVCSQRFLLAMQGPSTHDKGVLSKEA